MWGEGSKAGWEGSRRRGSREVRAGGGVGWMATVRGKLGLRPAPARAAAGERGVVTAGPKDPL